MALRRGGSTEVLRTCARLLRQLRGYRKVQHGLAVAARIGLDRMRAECRHFAAWLARIEALAAAE